MDPITGMITGGASLLGSLFSSYTSGQNTQANIANQQMMLGETQAFNTQNAQTAEDYTQTNMGLAERYNEQMSNTAYQRAAQDMKAAGLNPMAMFGSGGPASSPTVGAPSGPQASSPNPGSGNISQRTSPFAGIGDAVKTAVQSMVSAKTIDEMGARIANLNADKAVKESQPALIAAQTGETQARTGTEIARAANIRQQTATEAEATKTEAARAILAKLGIPAAGVSAIQADAILDLPDSVVRRAAQATYGTKTFGDIVAPVISSATGVGRIAETFKALRDRGYTDTTSEARYPDATFRSTTRRPN